MFAHVHVFSPGKFTYYKTSQILSSHWMAQDTQLPLCYHRPIESSVYHAHARAQDGRPSCPVYVLVLEVMTGYVARDPPFCE